eukprot:scaffold23208_cov124-Isochrysis_galbana.AAC.1
MVNGRPSLRTAYQRAEYIDIMSKTPPKRTCARTGPGTDTGAAPRPEDDDLHLRCGHRRIHSGNATAYWATAAHPHHTDISLCLPGGREHPGRNGSTFSLAAREREAWHAQHRLHTPGCDAKRHLRPSGRP